MSRTAALIIHYGDIEATRSTLKSLAPKFEGARFFIVNNTKDDISSLTKGNDQVNLVNLGENLGYARAINKGVAEASRDREVDSYFILNNDLKLRVGNLRLLRQALFELDLTGIVAPLLAHSQGLYDWGGKVSRWTGMVRHQNFKQAPKKRLHPEHVAGTAMLIKREAYERVGDWDGRFFMYYEDADYCLRMRQFGYSLIVEPQVVIEHDISRSSSPARRTLWQWRSHLQFVLKHLFNPILPSALLYNILVYPLFFVNSLLRGK